MVKRKSAWKSHKNKTVSGKLLAEQKRLAKRKDIISKAGAVSAGALGGGVSFFEVLSDALPGKRFQGRRHEVPGLLDEDTTWAFRAGAGAAMLIPVAGPGQAAGRLAVRGGMKVAPRATKAVTRGVGKGKTAVKRGTRTTGKLVLSSGKKAGRLAVKPVTIPARAAIGSGKYVVRKGGQVYRFTTLKAAGAFAKKVPKSRRLPPPSKTVPQSRRLAPPTTKEVVRYRPKSTPVKRPSRGAQKPPRAKKPVTIPMQLKKPPRPTKGTKSGILPSRMDLRKQRILEKMARKDELKAAKDAGKNAYLKSKITPVKRPAIAKNGSYGKSGGKIVGSPHGDFRYVPTGAKGKGYGKWEQQMSDGTWKKVKSGSQGSRFDPHAAGAGSRRIKPKN